MSLGFKVNFVTVEVSPQSDHLGNYIVCAAHAIQPDTPVENIMTTYDTALRRR